jgi:hypothetical protein
MRGLTDTDRNAARRRIAEKYHRSEAAVATIWLVFYVLAIGVSVASPLLSHAINFAAR